MRILWGLILLIAAPALAAAQVVGPPVEPPGPRAEGRSALRADWGPSGSPAASAAETERAAAAAPGRAIDAAASGADGATRSARSADLPSGSARSADLPSGSARSADLPSGSARSGDLPSGSARSADLPIESLPLGAPSEAQPLGAARSSGTAGSLGIGRTVIALAAVVAMAAMLAAAYRQWASRHGGLAMAMGAGGRAPSGVLEVLGRYPISRGLTLVLLKIDRRVLLLAQTRTGRFGTGSSLRALCEMSDPEEVASVLGRCRDEAGDSLAGKFRSMLQQFEATDEELDEIDGEPLRLVEFSGDGDRVELWDTGAEAEASDVWEEIDPYAQRGVG